MFGRLKQMFTRKPPRKFDHPVFGCFEGEGGIWTASIQHAGESFALALGGSSSAPDEALLSSASRVLSRFDELREIALAFIISQEAAARREDFSIYGVNFLWEERPDDFAFEFTMSGDLDGIWRVEFEAAIPKFLGRDD